MKKIQLMPYRRLDKKFKLKKHYIVKIEKGKKGDLIIPIPDDIVKAFYIEMGDIGIFEIIDKNTFAIKFVKKTMYGLVETNKKG